MDGDTTATGPASSDDTTATGASGPANAEGMSGPVSAATGLTGADDTPAISGPDGASGGSGDAGASRATSAPQVDETASTAIPGPADPTLTAALLGAGSDAGAPGNTPTAPAGARYTPPDPLRPVSVNDLVGQRVPDATNAAVKAAVDAHDSAIDRGSSQPEAKAAAAAAAFEAGAPIAQAVRVAAAITLPTGEMGDVPTPGAVMAAINPTVDPLVISEALNAHDNAVLATADNAAGTSPEAVQTAVDTARKLGATPQVAALVAASIPPLTVRSSSDFITMPAGTPDPLLNVPAASEANPLDTGNGADGTDHKGTTDDDGQAQGFADAGDASATVYVPPAMQTLATVSQLLEPNDRVVVLVLRPGDGDAVESSLITSSSDSLADLSYASTLIQAHCVKAVLSLERTPIETTEIMQAAAQQAGLYEPAPDDGTQL